MRIRIALGVVLVVCLAAPLFAETLKEFDERVERDLQALQPAAVPLWREANADRVAGRHAEAVQGYAAVFAQVPAFVHALRRQASEELELGNRNAALEHARQAVGLVESAENLAVLSMVLLRSSDGNPTGAEIEEAEELAHRAVSLNPNDPMPYSVLAVAAIQSDDLDGLAHAVGRLETLDGKSPGTHILRMTLDASKGNWSDARAALDRARVFGLPQSDYEGYRSGLESAIPFYLRWWKPAAITVGAWFATFGLLLLAGAILSRAALRAAHEMRTDGEVAGLSGGVRRAYATVLSLCSIFYYVSIPIVLLIVLATASSLLWGIFMVGHIPVKIVIVIVVVAGVSIWSMVKSLFIRRSDDEPGMRLDLAQEPKLRAVLDEVAARIGTRPVDNVYLTPGTDVAVLERGKGAPKERCLVLGVGVLDGFAMRPFKAVLGHEYGHFTNRDTAGGAFALRVRGTLHATAVALANGGAAAWYNPAWLFVNGFYRVFMRISQGASRLQEVLADRWAAYAYGASAFEGGLRHVIERSVRFDAHADATLKEVIEGKVALANLYTYAPSSPASDLTDAIAESLNSSSSAYDSHPSPSERFALVRSLPQRAQTPEADDDTPAWSLFANPESIQRAMTGQVRQNVRAGYGVEIAEPVGA